MGKEHSYSVPLKGWLWLKGKDLKNRTQILCDLKTLNDSAYLSRQDLRDLQTIKLRKLLSHLYRHVPYYSSQMKDLGFSSLHSPWDILRRFPIISKSELLMAGDTRFMRESTKLKPRWVNSSGSTGQPFKYYTYPRLDSFQLATQIRGWGFAGYRPGDAICIIGGQAIVADGKKMPRRNRLAKFLSHEHALLTVTFDDETLSSIYEMLRSVNPVWVFGYPSVLLRFAKYLSKQSISVSCGVRGIFSVAETLLPEAREWIEKAFKCPVYNDYGSGDGGVRAIECTEHNGMHVNTERCIVEIVGDDGKLVSKGEVGHIVCTDLENYASPFIRYRNGDMGSLTDRICPCGVKLPMLASVEGRSSDVIEFSNGKILSTPTAQLCFANQPWLEYVVVQTEKDSIEIKYIPMDSSEGTYENLLYELGKLCGPDVRISLKSVNEIKPGSAGKRRFFIPLN